MQTILDKIFRRKKKKKKKEIKQNWIKVENFDNNFSFICLVTPSFHNFILGC